MKRTSSANRETRWGKRLKALWPALPTRQPFALEVLEPRQLLSADVLPAAVVTTDQLDYAPGQTAIIAAFNSGTEGVEFLAGEEVQFQVTRTDGVGDNPLGNLPWIVTDG